ncbi:MAG: phosphodiesterase YaeI [Opitutae bacterium]|nr:phosphodiesterase YaeI [Opitutae bacterium]
MEREVPDYILDEEKRIKSRKAHARRSFFKKSFTWLSGLIASIFYLNFESNWLEVTRKKVSIPNLKNKVPLKILHLSDLHFSSSVSLQDIEIAMREGFALNPDACLITGDFITNQKTNEELEQYSKLLAKFAQNVPIFASLGNHDGGEWTGSRGGYTNSQKVEMMLKNAGIKLLHNRRESVYLKGHALSISGVGDLWSKTCLPQLCLPKRNGRTKLGPSILLCHNPDAKELLTPYQWDLMLCGHTHGGQFKIPFLNWTPFAPVKDHSMVEGLPSWKGRQIHITRGVGNLWGVRFNCRPEVSLLELTSA